MKKSIFNWVYKRNENENIIYNTYSKAVVVLDDIELKQYYEDNMQSDMCNVMKNNGIIVDDAFDELLFLKYIHYRAKFSKSVFRLTIAPTLDCNFDCPYCYENRRSGKMSEEIQNALINYIDENTTVDTNIIDISWYGGEPLLFPEIVEKLGKRIKSIANKKDIKLKMHMVTNGYLLTDKIVEMLDEIGVTKIQITIDGLQDNHNARRPLRNGKGSFDRIFDNLSLFDDFPIEVAVRMNVDNENKKDFAILKQKIDGLHNVNIKIYPSPVEDINKDKKNNVSKFMSAHEFDEFTLAECGSSSDEDFGVMDDRCCFCHAEMEQSYVVDELGDFYKCWDEVGRKEYRCFNVLEPNTIFYEHMLHFLSEDPFDDEKCKKCVFLPICFGGCKFQKNVLKKNVCAFNDEILNKYIETIYCSANAE